MIKFVRMQYKINHKGWPTTLKHALSFPFIWAPLFPTILLHIFIEIYHQICFPLYGIEKIKITRYVKFDRAKLNYLNPLEKIGCLYCSYMNGVYGYFVEIAGRTEKYWCGVKHMSSIDYIEPKHHIDFSEYGDEQDFVNSYSNKKTQL